MTPADAPPPLQFETAIPQGAAADAAAEPDGVSCRNCGRAIADEYFDLNSFAVCGSCREVLEERGQPARGMVATVRAMLFGLAAAVVGAILYYAVVAITNFEIGLVAIAIGFLVGGAVRKGTHGRGGRAFQIMALLLTYWSVGLAYIPLAFSGEEKETTAAVQSNTTDAVAPVATQSTQPATAPPAGGNMNLPLALAYLVAISFALPVLVVFGSMPGGLISAAIIGFGMQQAWRMTAAPQLTITGPFRVRAAEKPAT